MPDIRAAKREGILPSSLFSAASSKSHRSRDICSLWHPTKLLIYSHKGSEGQSDIDSGTGSCAPRGDSSFKVFCTCLDMSSWKVWHSKAVPAATLMVAASKTTICKAITSLYLTPRYSSRWIHVRCSLTAFFMSSIKAWRQMYHRKAVL